MNLSTLCNPFRVRALFNDKRNEVTWLTWIRAADYFLILNHSDKAITLLKYAFELADLTLSSCRCNQQTAVSRLTYSGVKLAYAYQCIGNTGVMHAVLSKTKSRLLRELPAPGISTWILGCMRYLNTTQIEHFSVQLKETSLLKLRSATTYSVHPIGQITTCCGGW